MRPFVCLLITLLAFGAAAFSQTEEREVYAIGFYNLENLFDTCHDAGKNDVDFLPDGRYEWNSEKYAHKLANMAKVLGEMGTDAETNLPGCAIIGVSEVENAACLTDLCSQPPLASRGIRFCHKEGPDARGIDCALLYDPKLFKPSEVNLLAYVPDNEKDPTFATRGFLTVCGTLGGEDIAVIVCHLPSRHNDSSYRECGAAQIRAIKDSLIAENQARKVVVMGDMNDDPSDESMANVLRARKNIKEVGAEDMYNPWWNVLENGVGTLSYKGKWNLFDQIILSPSLLGDNGDGLGESLTYWRNEVFIRDYLLHSDGDYKGTPLRTMEGGKWADGYSDHLPTIIYLSKK